MSVEIEFRCGCKKVTREGQVGELKRTYSDPNRCPSCQAKEQEMIRVELLFKCGHVRTVEVDGHSTAHQIVAAQHECHDCFVNSPIPTMAMTPPPDASQRLRILAEEIDV